MISQLLDIPFEGSFMQNPTDQLFIEKEKLLKLMQSKPVIPKCLE